MKRFLLTAMVALICLAAGNGDFSGGEIFLEVDNSDIIVRHVEDFVNCGLKFHSVVDKHESILTVREANNGGLACCTCSMELVTTIYDLNPGTYTVEVYNWNQSIYYGGGEVFVPVSNTVKLLPPSSFDSSQSGCLTE